MQSSSATATAVMPTMTPPDQTGDPVGDTSQLTHDQSGRSDVGPPVLSVDSRLPDGAAAGDITAVSATDEAQRAEPGDTLPEAGRDRALAASGISSHDLSHQHESAIPFMASKSESQNAATPAGVLTISTTDLAALLQDHQNRSWLSNHSGPIVGALIGAVMIAMIAFMQQGFNGIEADIAEVKADIVEIKADIVEIKADIAANKAEIAEVKAEIAEVKAEVADLRQDVNHIDKRLSVLTAILSLNREVDNAIQGKIITSDTTQQS